MQYNDEGMKVLVCFKYLPHGMFSEYVVLEIFQLIFTYRNFNIDTVLLYFTNLYISQSQYTLCIMYNVNGDQKLNELQLLYDCFHKNDFFM